MLWLQNSKMKMIRTVKEIMIEEDCSYEKATEIYIDEVSYFQDLDDDR